MTLILNGTDNSATTPAVTGTDTDTGVYYPAANQVALATNGTLALIVDASQNVGIGSASPGVRLEVSGASAASSFNALRMTNTDTTASSPVTTLFQSADDGTLRNRATMTSGSDGSNNGYIALSTRSSGSITEKFRLNSTGALILAGGSTSADGTGITFPATQNASTNANTLDDYEEGTWTPSLGGTATYSQQSGFYKKVGGLVYVSAVLQIASLGTGTSNGFTGLPFSGSAGPRNTFSLAYWGSAVGSLSYLAFYIGGSGTTAGCVAITTAASTIQDGYGVFQNGTYVIFSGCYHSS